MLTGSEMAVVDANAEALGVPRKQLMESSGHSLARAVREHADPGAPTTAMLTGSEMGVVDANAAALGVPRKQ